MKAWKLSLLVHYYWITPTPTHIHLRVFSKLTVNLPLLNTYGKTPQRNIWSRQGPSAIFAKGKHRHSMTHGNGPHDSHKACAAALQTRAAVAHCSWFI